MAQIEVSAVPYPEGDLRVVREDLTTSSFRLRLENFGLREEPYNRSRSQHWLLAGTKGKPPQFQVESASFIQLRNGKETTRTEELPESLRNNLVKVAELGLYRQWWTYSVAFTTASPIEDNVFWILDKAVIKFDIGTPDAPADEAFVGRFASAQNSVTDGLLLNPNVSSEYYFKDYADPVEKWKNWSARLRGMADTGRLFRLRIHQGGVYRISVKDIEGLTSDSLADVTQWRIYKGGQEIGALQQADLKDSLFVPVQSKPDDGFYEDVYWLDASGNQGATPPRRLSSAAGVTSTTIVTDLTTAGLTLTHRELKDYNPKLRAINGGDRWVWTNVYASAASTIDIEMPEYYAPADDALAQLTFTYGFTNFPSSVPAMLVYLNGNEVGQTTLTMQQGSATLSVPANQFKPGKNEASLVLDYPAGVALKREVSLQNIKTQWSQELPATFNKQFEVTIEPSTTSTQALLFPESLDPSAVALAYVNNEPRLLERDGNRIYTQLFSSQQIHLALLNDKTTTPVIEHVQSVVDLPEIKSARSVILAHESLVDASKALKDAHIERGLSTELYSAQQLYDVFSFGDADPDALRNALRYCFYVAPGDLPEYVTLIGEASDFQGDLRLPEVSVQPNLLPSSNANSPETSQGDQRYAASIGSDQLVDMKVGRIPAATAEQVAGYVDKVNRYYNSHETNEAWNRHVGFAMDDNDEFPEVVERIIKSSMSAGSDLTLLRQWDYEYVPNLRVPGTKRSWQATERLINEFNSGYSVLNFFGHGGPNLWSHERLFHLSDMALVQNASRLPLITCASCDNAWISYPTPPVQASMGELLVLKTDGGAIALFGPVAGASPYEHAVLVQSLMSGIFRTQLKSFGHLILYAKNSYFSSTRSSSIMDQYLLLGDPAAILHYPSVKPGLQVANASGIQPGSTVKVVLPKGIKDIETTGLLKVISSSSPEDVLTSLPVLAKQRSWEFLIPESVGNGALQFALDAYSSAGLSNRYGAIARVSPARSNEENLPIFLEQTGSDYKITALDGINTNIHTGNVTIKLKLNASDTASTSVAVYATDSLGTTIGEVARLEIPQNTKEAVFDLSTSARLTGAETTLSLSVVPLSTSRENAVSTTTLLFKHDAPIDLAMVPGSATVYTKGTRYTAFSTVFLEADLVNHGETTIKNVALQALNGDPTTGTELQTINSIVTQKLNELRPGEKRRVQFRWENPAPGKYDKIYLVVNKAKSVQEQTFDNNSILMPPIEVSGIQNYIVKEFTLDKHTVSPGDMVELKMVFERQNPSNDHPVTLEVGWVRTMDRKTSYTRSRITFDDTLSTSVQQLVVPEGFNQVYCKINADLEIEESNPGDNSMNSDNIVVARLPENSASEWALSEYIEWGNGFNLILLPGPKVTVSTEFTSQSQLLAFDKIRVLSGEVGKAFADNDNQWGIVPWKLGVGAHENAGNVELEIPVGSSHRVPGMARAYFNKKPASGAPLKYRQGKEESAWHEPVFEREQNGKYIYIFESLYAADGNITFELQPIQGTEIDLNYMQYFPHAIEWESPPFKFDQDRSGKGLEFSVETDDVAAWESIMLDYRLGSRGEQGHVQWGEWQSSPGSKSLSVRFNASPIFQLRIVAAPVSGKKPSLSNFRLKPL